MNSHYLRRVVWKLFGGVLVRFGYEAETNSDESVFYIYRVR